jgi:hypothetical protein
MLIAKYYLQLLLIIWIEFIGVNSRGKGVITLLDRTLLNQRVFRNRCNTNICILNLNILTSGDLEKIKKYLEKLIEFFYIYYIYYSFIYSKRVTYLQQ